MVVFCLRGVYVVKEEPTVLMDPGPSSHGKARVQRGSLDWV